MTSDAQKAAERLGVRFARCAQCDGQFVWHEEETFSVTDGNDDIVFCCSHLCASRKLATLPADTGIIWRGGKCGGTLMPSLEEP
jgi:hypothetical protein